MAVIMRWWLLSEAHYVTIMSHSTVSMACVGYVNKYFLTRELICFKLLKNYCCCGLLVCPIVETNIYQSWVKHFKHLF